MVPPLRVRLLVPLRVRLLVPPRARLLVRAAADAVVRAAARLRAPRWLEHLRARQRQLARRVPLPRLALARAGAGVAFPAAADVPAPRTWTSAPLRWQTSALP